MMLLQMPVFLVMPVIFSTITYWMVGRYFVLVTGFQVLLYSVARICVYVGGISTDRNVIAIS